MKFIKCFTVNQKEKLQSAGFQYFKEDNGEYWFLFDSNVRFTFSEGDFEIVDRINI